MCFLMYTLDATLLIRKCKFVEKNLRIDTTMAFIDRFLGRIEGCTIKQLPKKKTIKGRLFSLFEFYKKHNNQYHPTTMTSNQSKLSTITLATLAATMVAAGYSPKCYDTAHNFNNQLLTKWGEHLVVERVSTKSKSDGISGIIKTCFSADTGEQQPEDVCIGQITEALVACGFSSIAYHGTMQQTKREEITTKFLQSLGKDLEVHGVYENDKDVTSQFATVSGVKFAKRDDENKKTYKLSTSSPSLKSASSGNDNAPIQALVSSKNSKDANTLPFLIKTDGEITELAHTVITGKAKRDDEVTGWELKSGKGVKLYANSDPIASYDDVVNWLHSREPEGCTYPTVLAGFISAGKGDYLGATLADQTADNFYNGQWLAEAKHGKFEPGWEANKNWCYGVYKTNCDDNAGCKKESDLPSGA